MFVNEKETAESLLTKPPLAWKGRRKVWLQSLQDVVLDEACLPGLKILFEVLAPRTVREEPFFLPLQTSCSYCKAGLSFR